MTITLLSEIVNGIKISIRQDSGSPSYIVEDFPRVSAGLYGYSITKHYYSTLEKAKRRYSTLKRKYQK